MRSLSPNRSSLRAFLVAMLLAAAGTSSALLYAQADRDRDQAGGSPASADDLRHAYALSDAFKQVARSLAPSVVNIRSTQQLAPSDRENQLQDPTRDTPFDDEFFRRFFGGEMPQFPRERVGEGTGVIARSDGYIVTNNHVVSGASEIRVTLDDEREYDATVIGTDAETDLAVVRIDASGLTPAKWGDSASMEIGDWVLAMGSPFGLQHTVTAGIISAKGRGLGLATYEDFIQTDAAINPGNSGGPLVNLHGEVVGINTAISTRTGAFAGVGFAIPSNMVKEVAESIIETGGVERGWLGVQMQPLNDDLAKQLGFDSTDGVLIAEVLPDTPAEAAGLQDKDIILRYNDTKVNDTRQLLNLVARTKPGDIVPVRIFRDGERQNLEVKVDKRPQQDTLAQRNRQQQETQQDFGMRVEPITSRVAERLGLRDTRGVIVTAVLPNSPAAEQGIAAGDVILEVGDTVVRDMDDYSEAMSKADAEAGVMVRVRGSAGSRLVVLKRESDED